MLRSVLRIIEFVTNKWDGFILWWKRLKRRAYENRVDAAVDANDNNAVSDIVQSIKDKRDKRRDET